MNANFDWLTIAVSAVLAGVSIVFALRANMWIRHRRQNLEVAAELLNEFHRCAGKLLRDKSTPPELIPMIRTWVAAAGHPHMAAWLEAAARRGHLFGPMSGQRLDRAQAIRALMHKLPEENQIAFMNCFMIALYSSAYVSLRHADLRLSIVRGLMRPNTKKVVVESPENVERIALDYAVSEGRSKSRLSEDLDQLCAA